MKSKEALAMHKEHSRLVKLAGHAPNHDYQHAGVAQLEDQIEQAKEERHALETTVTWTTAEIGMFVDNSGRLLP